MTKTEKLAEKLHLIGITAARKIEPKFSTHQTFNTMPTYARAGWLAIARWHQRQRRKCSSGRRQADGLTRESAMRPIRVIEVAVTKCGRSH